MSIVEAIFKVEIGKVTIKHKKGSGMTAIIIVFLICCTLITCCIARYTKFERAHYTVNVSVNDQETALWILQKLPPATLRFVYPDENGAERPVNTEEK